MAKIILLICGVIYCVSNANCLIARVEIVIATFHVGKKVQCDKNFTINTKTTELNSSFY